MKRQYLVTANLNYWVTVDNEESVSQQKDAAVHQVREVIINDHHGVHGHNPTVQYATTGYQVEVLTEYPPRLLE